ncbi:RNA polymerase sigma factor [candidate division KSB1 bacterium]
MIFETLYTEYFETIYAFSFRMTGDTVEAEDITQETFIRLYDYLQKGKTVYNPKAWLYRVAANLCINQLKQKKRFRMFIKSNMHDPNKTSNIETEYLKQERHERINNALQQLSLQDRVLLQLYQDGLSYAEISEAASINRNSVGKMLSRAIEKAANILKEEDKIVLSERREFSTASR